jgi:hypothetical protein
MAVEDANAAKIPYTSERAKKEKNYLTQDKFFCTSHSAQMRLDGESVTFHG